MATIQKISLFFKEGSSDKEYHVQLEESGSNYVVNFQYGRRGSTLKADSKTKAPVSLEEAMKIYDRLVREKMGKGYQEAAGSSQAAYVSAGAPAIKKETIFTPQLLDEISEAEAEKFLMDDAWGIQEKKNGKHQTIHRKASVVTVTNKKGQAIGYPAIFGELPYEEDLIFDGEAIGDTFHVFDCLMAEGKDLRNFSYQGRHKALTTLFPALNVVPLVTGTKAKRAFFEKMKKENREGVVFKRLASVYKPGKGHSDMVKCKFWAELSARVSTKATGKDSVIVELLDDSGKWQEMGSVTTIGKGRILPGMIIEVRYLYCLKGGSLYQPNVKEIRDDVDEEECTMKQIKYKPEED